MTDVTGRIAFLSTALKAISQINNEGSADLYDSIERCLRHEVTTLQKENYETIKAARSAESSTDNDIPF